MIRKRTAVLLAALSCALPIGSSAQSIEVSAANQRVQHPTPSSYGQAEIRVHGPHGYRFEQRVNASSGFLLNTAGLADGSYRYSIQFSSPQPASGAGTQIGDEQGRRAGTRPGPAAPEPVDGSFVMLGGQVHLSTGSEQQAREDEPKQGKAAPIAKDQVIADDLIVQGSGCFGFDCIDNESFGADTIRLKENNLRIHFEDTSATAGFATNDWRLTANDQASGGIERFSIEDATNARIPLTIEGNASTNSIYVDSTGRVGLRTATPVLDLHVNTSNTPALRLEQNSSGGFTAQTWDIGGNEANFFVRDVTGGSKLSLRIRPGAPTSSLDISASGNVGVGTGSPDAKLDVANNAASNAPTLALLVSNVHADFTGVTDRFTVDSSGNVFARGSISQLSSRDAKTDFVSADGDAVLARIAALPISSWRYKDAAGDDRHFGPMAQDFHAAFGLGHDDTQVAPADMAGVALAAIQALNAQLAERDARIAGLEQRLQALEHAAGAQ
ncbi:MAG: tail fiber domain-containing protein [Xanthomonadales bacterium]|nr:tail fiber domain-containing protein [Xanthomonadales bacterium]MBK7144427.1 tail fiber domain-containing protein [Xanthomonadales bacterium]